MNWDELRDWMRRQGKPPTKAREQRYYGDPAQTVEFEGEIERRRKAKAAQKSKNPNRGK